MNLTTLNNNNTTTMTSREIASVTGKEHRNVLADIEKLNATYEEMGMLKVQQGYYTHERTGNQQHRQFTLDKQQTLDLITGYTPVLRIKINRRWAELEEQVANPQPVLPATYIEALEALIGSEKQKLEISYQLEEAQKEIAVAAPKVEHFNITMDSNNTTKASTVAGYLGIGVQTLNDILDHEGWYYKKVTGRAREFKQHVVTSGSGKKLQIKYNIQQSVFTPKGIAEIVALINTEEGKQLIDRFEPKSEKLARARQARKEAKEALQCPERVEHTQNTIIHIETILKQA